MQAYIERQIDSRPGLLKFSEYPTNHKKDASVLNGATCRRLWGKEDRCESAEEAIFIDGNERGKITFICRNKDCPKHGVRARQTAGGDNSDAALRRKHKFEKAFRQKLFAAISDKVNSVPGGNVTRIVAREMWRRIGGDSKRAMLKAAAHDVSRESTDEFVDRLIETAEPVELGRSVWPLLRN